MYDDQAYDTAVCPSLTDDELALLVMANFRAAI